MDRGVSFQKNFLINLFLHYLCNGYSQNIILNKEDKIGSRRDGELISVQTKSSEQANVPVIGEYIIENTSKYPFTSDSLIS